MKTRSFERGICMAIIAVCVVALCIIMELLIQSNSRHNKRVAMIERCTELEIGTPDECEFTLRSIGPDQFDQMIRENEAAKWQIGGPAK